LNVWRQARSHGVRYQKRLTDGLARILNATSDVHRIADHSVFEPVLGSDVACDDRTKVDTDSMSDFGQVTTLAVSVELGPAIATRFAQLDLALKRWNS
jgi:hypothetical protein